MLGGFVAINRKITPEGSYDPRIFSDIPFIFALRMLNAEIIKLDRQRAPYQA